MTSAGAGESTVGGAFHRARRSAWLRRLALLVVAALVTAIVVRLIGRIDWEAVYDALRHLTWWQPFVLLAVVVVRQVLNALPLALYIPRVSALRATVNDLGAILMSAVAPPPSDLALRVGMFNSWGVPTVQAVAGTLMNTLTFYIVRFAAPLLGFVLLLAVDEPAGLRWLDLAFVAIAVAILVAVLLVVRSDQLAIRVGSFTGRMARKVRRSVDPDAWVRACVDFRVQISARFSYGFVRSLLALCGMLAADLTVLVLSLRFVGVSSSEVALVYVAIAYLFAYPVHPVPLLRTGNRGRAGAGRRGRGRRARGRGGRRRGPGRVAGLHGGGADPDGPGCRHRVAPGMARRRPTGAGVARRWVKSRLRPYRATVTRVYVAGKRRGGGVAPREGTRMPRRRRHLLSILAAGAAVAVAAAGLQPGAAQAGQAGQADQGRHHPRRRAEQGDRRQVRHEERPAPDVPLRRHAQQLPRAHRAR